jgi:hypothetical protein
MGDLAFSKRPYKHVFAVDKDRKYKATVEKNLRTKFIHKDAQKLTANEIESLLKKKNCEAGDHVHMTACLDCRDASTASGASTDYKAYEEQVAFLSKLTNRLASKYFITTFSEFIVDTRMLSMFRKYFPTASIAVVEKVGEEKRLRVFIANGFSIEDLAQEADAKASSGKSVKAILGRGTVKSNTGSRARWKSTGEPVGTITCTGMSYRNYRGNIEQVSNEKLLELRSAGAEHSYDISQVGLCLGRVIVGQGVSLVLAEVAARYCARAHCGDSE